MVAAKKNLQRVVLNLPPKTAATLEYLVSIAQVSRSKSDLFVQMLNEYVEKMRPILNDNESWKHFTKSFDNKKLDKVDDILGKYLNMSDETEVEEEE
jgi:hypothetical protein